MMSSGSAFVSDKMNKKLRSKRFILRTLFLTIGISILASTSMEQKTRELMEEEKMRDLISVDKGGGACDIGLPFEDAPNIPSSDTTRTLLAGYPGSGKRFTWAVIKALTNYEIADDWNFSGKLFDNPLAIKTAWPHREGRWSWYKQMDQVLLLIRNPRRAIPSYHNLRWELEYSKTWHQSFLRISNTYSNRPTIEQWESWRDQKFDHEIDEWFDFYDFWMQAGFMEDQNETNFRCIYSDIDCQPKEVVDFENLYTDTPTADFLKIGALLDASENVEVIANQARACVLNNVFNRTGHQDLNMHQGNRPFPELPMEYQFTLPQFDRIMNRTIELRDKYSIEPLNEKPHAAYFVETLNKYIDDNTPEFYDSVDLYLLEFVADELGDVECDNLFETEATVCNFMKSKDNHDIFSDGFYPDDFPYPDWLKERSILMRMYLNHGGDTWATKSGWLGTSDHCGWEGVKCAEMGTENEFRITELSLPNNQLVGSFPLDLRKLNDIEVLNMSSNSLHGTIANDVCTRSTSGALHINADAANCPNDFDGVNGEYLDGCCDEILIDVDIYLSYFAIYVLGDDDCANLGGTETSLCEYMVNKNNHEIFANGFPADHPDVWSWLKERAILARMYLNDGDLMLTRSNSWFGWLGSSDQCSWQGVTCTDDLKVEKLIVQNSDLSGAYPQDLNNLGNLTLLSTSENYLTGIIPSDVCDRSIDGELYIVGDAVNCPNDFDSSTGEYLEGCCDVVNIDVDIYLKELVIALYGDDNCANLDATESPVCEFMLNKSNHAKFDNTNPKDIPGVWEWLKERATLVEMYVNNGGSFWTGTNGWLTSSNHCNWDGITCSAADRVIILNIQNNQLSESFPLKLNNLNSLQTLNIHGNSMVGTIPDDICSRSTSGEIFIHGDAGNCPNYLDPATGEYQDGCCDSILMDVEVYLDEVTATELGSADCDNLVDTDKIVCAYMTNQANHDIFANGFPSDFDNNLWEWLKERSILTRMYVDNEGESWSMNTGWLGSSDHCTWDGISCTTSSTVSRVALANNQLSGSFPPELGSLGSLQILNLSGNSLSGTIPDDVCNRSVAGSLFVNGDSTNCPNEFDQTTGKYLSGCCDNVLVNVDTYLNEFASHLLGDGNCASHSGSEGTVCEYMSEKANHDILANGYPTDFNGDVWAWLRERAALVRMYMSSGGDSWTVNTGWLNSANHCTWEGITCATANSVSGVALYDNELSGTYPTDLGSISNLESLNLSGNSMVGHISDDVCTRSMSNVLYISGDAENCPNILNEDTGDYEAGCCDNILTDVDTYLFGFAAAELGDAVCTNLEGNEVGVCDFMTKKENHKIFVDGYPSDFNGNVREWLGERAILVRLYLNDADNAWIVRTHWLSDENHCIWEGVRCNGENSVIEVSLQSNKLTGPYPYYIGGLRNLQTLNLNANHLVGTISDDVCERSLNGEMFIFGDAGNCPNSFDTTTGTYDSGCCDSVLIDVDVYLKEFAKAMLGDENCSNLEGTESNVCDYMTDKSNHAFFTYGYPAEFDGDVWGWLKERAVLARLYLNTAGSSWTDSTGWMGSDNHCNWKGVSCTDLFVAKDLNLENNNLIGPFPSDVSDLKKLDYLNLASNHLVGTMPNMLCHQSLTMGLSITGDGENCPNVFDTDSGTYLSGCCDKVHVN